MAASTLLPPSAAGFGSAFSAAVAVAAKAKKTQHRVNAIIFLMGFSVTQTAYAVCWRDRCERIFFASGPAGMEGTLLMTLYASSRK